MIFIAKSIGNNRVSFNGKNYYIKNGNRLKRNIKNEMVGNLVHGYKPLEEGLVVIHNDRSVRVKSFNQFTVEIISGNESYRVKESELTGRITVMLFSIYFKKDSMKVIDGIISYLKNSEFNIFNIRRKLNLIIKYATVYKNQIN